MTASINQRQSPQPQLRPFLMWDENTYREVIPSHID
jgi:hypothetical protein